MLFPKMQELNSKKAMSRKSLKILNTTGCSKRELINQLKYNIIKVLWILIFVQQNDLLKGGSLFADR
jgi:hypothetical protein